MMLRIIGISVAALLIVFLVALLVWWRRRPGKLDTLYFSEQWAELQKLCSSKATWPEAVLSADRLLGQALAKKHIRGRTMGTQLMKAQRTFSDNDSVWFAHKLRGKIEADPALKLKQADVKQALMGVRQALKDIGALA
ncbi:MAG TPA: hypothetical protein VLH84_03890 [Patescibacteria group bacterium]|nr:hypothetical protein [Patescibacteria group bacterium]